MIFRNVIPGLAAAITLVSLTPTVANAQTEQTWFHDLPSAQRVAKEKNLPLLVHFSAKWCIPCQKMEGSVLNQRVVKGFFGKQLIACKIDGDVYPELLTRYGIETYPTDLVLDPRGKELQRNQGDLNIVDYVEFVQAVIPKPAPETKPQTLIAKKPKLGLGLDGYCPVTLKRSRKWTKGKPKFKANYKGIDYQFQSQKILDSFNSAPAEFAPKLLGCDPVVLTESHRAIPGFTKYGAFFDEKLFLFSSAENRTRFKKNPLEFTRTRHVLKADDIIRTAIQPKGSSSS